MPMTKQEVEKALDSGILIVLVRNPWLAMQVPEGLSNPLILKFSKHFRESGVEVTDTYIKQTLTYGGKPFETVVPLGSIMDYRIDDHDFKPAPIPQGPRLRLINGGKE